jgi:hypothetical protein
MCIVGCITLLSTILDLANNQELYYFLKLHIYLIKHIFRLILFLFYSPEKNEIQNQKSQKITTINLFAH